MLTTTNYGLKKPEGTDVVDIQNFNDNADIIDQALKKHDSSLSDMVQDSYPSVIATGTNSYIGSTDKIKALGKGTTKLTLFVGADATGNCSLNLNSYGAKNIKDSFGNIVNNLKKDIPYNICYNGTDFILQGKGGGGDADPSQVLSGKKATVDNGQIVGTMPERGNISATLNAGQSYTIAEGHHEGGGKVTANSLASQTPANADEGKILSGYSAWVNGNKVDGKATIESLGGRQFQSGSFVGNLGTVTINLPFKPSIVYMYYSYYGTLMKSVLFSVVDPNTFYNLSGTGTSVGSVGNNFFTRNGTSDATWYWYAWE